MLLCRTLLYLIDFDNLKSAVGQKHEQRNKYNYALNCYQRKLKMCKDNDVINSNFENFLKQYINKLDDVIQNLHELKKTITSHHHISNIAKSAGTVMGGTGVAVVIGSVLSVPIIGGSVLPLGAGGAVMTLTGSLSNAITDYVNYKTTKVIINSIQEIIDSKQSFDENLSLQLKHFGIIIEKLIESGLDQGSAVIVTVKAIANGCIDLSEEPNMKIMNALSTIVKLHHIEVAALETLPLIAKTLHISEKSFKFICNFFGFTTQTGAVIFKTIGRIFSVTSIAFTIVDIALLIKDWRTEHPTIEVVMEAEMKVQEEKHILQDLLEVIESSKDNAQHVWMEMLIDIKKSDAKEFALEHDFVIIDKENNNCDLKLILAMILFST